MPIQETEPIVVQLLGLLPMQCRVWVPKFRYPETRGKRLNICAETCEKMSQEG